MKVLFVSSELTPLAKVGGLADVAGALPKALKKLGIDIRAVLPFYDVIDQEKYRPEFLDEIKVSFGQVNESVKIYQTKIPDSTVPVYLLENKEYLSRGGVYFEKSAFVGSFKEIERFLFFSQAILEILPVLNWQIPQNNDSHSAKLNGPDIIHCQDWHTAVLPLLFKLKPQNLKPKTLFTIHNLANQGQRNTQEVLNFLGLEGNELEILKQGQVGSNRENINLIQQGILNADLLNTVSPSYAKEILTKEFGEGLEKTLQKREKDLFGILNGIDTESFSPEKDKKIKINYSLKTLDRKNENKKDLQQTIGLPSNDSPLLGLVSRLTNQKGSELVYQIAPDLIKQGCQFVFLGQGSNHYEEQLEELAKKYPKNVYTKIGFDDVLAQKIYAGVDLFLVPSRFEPCGLTQMIAMRYGTVPIVRATGGLKDSVENVKIKDKKVFGNGFVFGKYDPQQLLTAISFAFDLFKNKKIWQQIQQNAMKKDFSWRNSAQKYLELYNNLLQSTN